MSSRYLQRYPGDIHTHVINTLLFLTVVGVWRGTNLALAVAGGKDVGTGWYSGGFGVGNGLERGVPQIEQDGGRFSLGVTGSRIEEQCRTDFCAPKYARDSFNLTTSVENGFLFDTLSEGPRGKGLALAVAGGKEVGTGWYSGGFGVGIGL
ncbi:unnamed protein product, partial [Ectocarpus sp. 12 AP-2014]